MATATTLVLPYRKRARSPEKDGEGEGRSAAIFKRKKAWHNQEEEEDWHEKEIQQYIRQKLRIGTSDRVEIIREHIRETSAGIVLWAALVIPILNEEFRNQNLVAVELKLKTLPSELPELLSHILKRNNSTNEDKFLLCLQWLLYPRRLLHVNEFYLAIISGLKAPQSILAWDPQNYTADHLQKFVSDISLGLAKISDSGNVILAHESIRDFLLSRGGTRLLWPNIADFRSRAHNSLKECCFRYIDCRISNTKFLPVEKAAFDSHEASWIRQEALEEFPFLAYANQSALYHADAAARGIAQEEFLASLDLQGWVKVHNLLEQDEGCHYTLEVNILYILAERNYPKLIRTLLDSDPQINIQGERYKYPLFAALANGHRAAARELIRQPISVLGDGDSLIQLPYNKDFVLPESLNPLQWSVEEKHVALTKRLIASGEFDDKLFDHRGKPLIVWAAMYGQEDILEMLIETKNVHVNTRDSGGNTALLQAAIHRRESMVKYLLSQPGIDVNTQDDGKYSPLLWAAINGHEAITELLLATPGVNVNILNYMDETPLMWAAQLERVGLVNRLLAMPNIYVNLTDKSGRTALSRAVEYGRVYAVKVLLASPGIETDTRDRLGLSPLFEALRRGNHAIADLIGHLV